VAIFWRKFVIFLGMVVLLSLNFIFAPSGAKPPAPMETAEHDGYRVVCSGEYTVVTVQRGDTLGNLISSHVSISTGGVQLAKKPTLEEAVGAVARGNKIANPDLLDVGQSVVMPSRCLRSFDSGY
jgi:nucleoid-associated protein YgaU